MDRKTCHRSEKRKQFIQDFTQFKQGSSNIMNIQIDSQRFKIVKLNSKMRKKLKKAAQNIKETKYK